MKVLELYSVVKPGGICLKDFLNLSNICIHFLNWNIDNILTSQLLLLIILIIFL